MRTTITLDPDVVALIEEERRLRGTTFKQVVNEKLRRGFALPSTGESAGAFRTPVHDSGRLLRPFETASKLLAEMDEERWIETD